LLRAYDHFKAHPEEEVSDEQVESFQKVVENIFPANWTLHNNIKINEQIRVLFQHIYDTQNMEEEKIPLDGPIKYRLVLAPSSIPDAGNGVFVRCTEKIVPGTVLGLYPGIVHISSVFKNKNYIQGLMPDDDLMLIKRLDGTVIDPRMADRCPKNPYGLAHMINHCGATGPNIKQVIMHKT
jgi:hypothetical protein